MGNAGDSNCDKADLYPQCGIFGQCLALGGFRIRELREDVSSRQAGFRHFGHLYPRRRCRFETTEFLAENCCGTCVRRPRNPLNINRVAKYQYFVKVFFARLSFCEVPNDRILVETGLLWAIRDAFPVTPLHTLVVPKRHVPEVFDLSRPETNAYNELLSRAKQGIKEADSAVTGFNIGINNGEVAGQTVPHCHIHLIPRRLGDVPNPVGGIRNVIPGKGPY